jgi:pimeloyl-ACP methyl ester carboxylesterase
MTVRAGCMGAAGGTSGRERAAEVSASGAVRSPSAGPLARFTDQRLRWRSCRDGFECTRLVVPVDYGNPTGGTLSLAVVRLPARGDAKASLVLNPGGPGSSGVDYARAAARVVSADVRARFDVVGFDPRGVARSRPIDCLSDRELDRFLAADGSPDDPAEEQALDRVSRTLGAGCADARPGLVDHVGTRDVARDLNVLRAALGDRRLHYLGKSYGTLIGTTYADLFPRRVGRLVLDGVLDPALSGEEVAYGQAVGFERAFRSFLRDCLRRTSCPLSGSDDQAQAQVGRLLDEIDGRPLRGEPGRPVTQSLAVLGFAAAMYAEGSWPVLRRGIAEAMRGEGRTLLALADYYSDRGPDGAYTTNALEALYAVNCLDRPEASDLDGFRAAASRAESASPVFGAFIAWGGLPCASWPVPAQGAPHPVRAESAGPILLVGTTRDPATPYAWARSSARALESGRLLTMVGDGHTAYRKGSGCIDRAVDRYLLDGRLPARGTRCR